MIYVTKRVNNKIAINGLCIMTIIAIDKFGVNIQFEPKEDIFIKIKSRVYNHRIGFFISKEKEILIDDMSESVSFRKDSVLTLSFSEEIVRLYIINSDDHDQISIGFECNKELKLFNDYLIKINNNDEEFLKEIYEDNIIGRVRSSSY